MKYPVTAVILAAGKGLRMGGLLPKQFQELAGRPMLVHALEAFDAAPSVNAIVIVSSEEELIREKILKHWLIKKPIFFAEGGRERQYSVWNALNAIENSELVVIHDGVRPLVQVRVIEESIAAARQFGAAAAGMPSKDTIKEVNEQGFSIRTPDRSRLWMIHTPQAFKFSLLKDAHLKARQESWLGTDDSSLVERMGHPVKLIEAGYDNIKITTPEDLVVASHILKCRNGKESRSL
ncbi:MAG TPA: 2-C-methyl-D-erythritol 4-phosphate cytidylyltransferase [Clostridiales bacterium]|nr:2-C-methyl-D-erythritol 4-phosphate cytidylyltransferase [Clostridia bacterium]HCS75393.1 2-C-methyl-D-erythritol 4-phosphate cytidylyltransferase [Clostridiales bacterium]